MFDEIGFTDDKVVAGAAVDAAPLRAAANAYTAARKPLLRFAAYCDACRAIFNGQQKFDIYRPVLRDLAVKAAFNEYARSHAANFIRAAGYEFDESFFDTVPPEPTTEELATEIKDLSAKLKTLTTKYKQLTRPLKAQSDKSIYAREYARYHRELRRIDAS